MPESSNGNGDKRSSETYARLVDATVGAVFDDGYAGATMARIAERAGVTRGAIQHHFGDRQVDIIAKVTEQSSTSGRTHMPPSTARRMDR